VQNRFMRRFVLFLLTAAILSAQSGKPKAPGEDWVALFNGKDLAGWIKVGNETWTAENGTIHGIAATKGYGYLRTEQNFKDFHMSLRFKCEGDGNSGVFFHVEFKPGTADVVQGPQFEIDCNIGRHTGGIYDVGRQWLIWPAPENETVIRSDDWNEYLLKVEGNRYVARLNGVQMVDYTDPKPFGADGGIALQLHSGGHGNMRFKDILIRDLSKR
jgi:3-keto-disaccharide hydrolase